MPASRTSARIAPPSAAATVRYRERVAEHMLLACLDFTQAIGLTPAQARRAFRRASSGARRKELGATLAYRTLLGVSDILGDWHQQPEWLDEAGAPRALPLSGARSFTTLSQRHVPQMSPAVLMQHLLTEGVLKQTAKGAVTPVQRAAMFAANNPMSLDRMPVLLQGIFSTFLHNGSPEGRHKGTRLERGTTISQLPVEQIPAFNKLVKLFGHALLDQIDRWALTHESQPTTTRKTARVGVEVFAYVEPNATPRSARRKRPR